MNQKAKLTPTKFRFIGYIPIAIILPLTIIIFKPSVIEIIAASIAGIFTSLYDWIIEAYAYKKGLWFCYGGIQKIEIGNRTIDFKHVPIDMIVGFWFWGFIFSLFSTFPDRNRTFYQIITNPTLTNPVLDPLWILIFCFILSTGGAFMDFLSKRFGVWQNGKTWNFAKCAYIAWFSLLGFTIVTFYAIIGLFNL